MNNDQLNEDATIDATLSTIDPEVAAVEPTVPAVADDDTQQANLDAEAEVAARVVEIKAKIERYEEEADEEWDPMTKLAIQREVDGLKKLIGV